MTGDQAKQRETPCENDFSFALVVRFVATTTSRRPYRPHGSVRSKANLFAKVDPSLKVKLDRLADAVGVSQGAALELVLENLQIDANGRPPWYDGPLADDKADSSLVDRKGAVTAAALPAGTDGGAEQRKAS